MSICVMHALKRWLWGLVCVFLGPQRRWPCPTELFMLGWKNVRRATEWCYTLLVYIVGHWTVLWSHSSSCHGLLKPGHVYQWKASKSVSLMARTVWMCGICLQIPSTLLCPFSNFDYLRFFLYEGSLATLTKRVCERENNGER